MSNGQEVYIIASTRKGQNHPIELGIELNMETLDRDTAHKVWHYNNLYNKGRKFYLIARSPTDADEFSTTYAIHVSYDVSSEKIVSILTDYQYDLNRTTCPSCSTYYRDGRLMFGMHFNRPVTDEIWGYSYLSRAFKKVAKRELDRYKSIVGEDKYALLRTYGKYIAISQESIDLIDDAIKRRFLKEREMRRASW